MTTYSNLFQLKDEVVPTSTIDAKITWADFNAHPTNKGRFVKFSGKTGLIVGFEDILAPGSTDSWLTLLMLFITSNVTLGDNLFPTKGTCMICYAENPDYQSGSFSGQPLDIAEGNFNVTRHDLLKLNGSISGKLAGQTFEIELDLSN